MFIYLLLLFTVIPLVELVILIRIGQYIGTLNTILIVVITGIIGASLAKYQGLKVVIRIRKEIASGQLP
ncbi:FxsA family protein, partial [bacterium]|nr:FxsA family protein [bacterium]